MAAAQFRDAGFDQAYAESVLVPRAVADGLEEQKARKSVASIYKRAPRESAPSGSASSGSSSYATPPPPRQSAPKSLPSPIPDGFRVLLGECFQPGERVVIGKGSVNGKGETEIDGGTMNKVDGWLRRLNGKTVQDIYPQQKDGLFLRINPMKGQGKADVDVDVYRYVLVEFDEDKNGNLIPKELQYAWLLDSGLPIDAIVDSGKRSIQGCASRCSRPHGVRSTVRCYYQPFSIGLHRV